MPMDTLSEATDNAIHVQRKCFAVAFFFDGTGAYLVNYSMDVHHG